MKRTREIVVQGKIFRETEETNGAVEWLQNFNQSAGRSLSPIRFKGGFAVSTSWLLFGLIFMMPNDGLNGVMVIMWLISLAIRFE